MASCGWNRLYAVCGTAVIFLAVSLSGAAVAKKADQSAKADDPPAIPADAVLVEAALAPDLDGDGLPEIRARLEADSGEWTVILGSATESPIYLITGREPFDPWAESPADISGDGQADEWDLAQLVIEQRTIEVLAAAWVKVLEAGWNPNSQRRENWNQIQDGPNVDSILPGSSLLVEIASFFSDLNRLIAVSADRSRYRGAMNALTLHTPYLAQAIETDHSSVLEMMVKTYLQDYQWQLIPSGGLLYAVNFYANGDGSIHQILTDRHHEHPPYPADYEWLDEDGNGTPFGLNDQRSPVCYTCGSVVRMQIKIRYSQGASLDESVLRLKGYDTTSGMATAPYFQSSSVSVENEGGFVVVSADVNGPGATSIDVWDERGFAWVLEEFDPQTGITVDSEAVGVSYHTIYFVRNNPLQNKAILYHTAVDIACRGAKHLSRSATDLQVLDAIWSKFESLQIFRAQDTFEQLNPVQLKYYKNWNISNTSVGAMLASSEGDGQCYAWAKLLSQCLFAHGIDFADEYRILRAPLFPNANPVFAVKNWFVPQDGANEHQEYGDEYPYLNVAKSPLIVSNEYKWHYIDVEDDPGVPGQWSQDPASLFAEHAFLVIEGNVYDPSYGEKVPIMDDGSSGAELEPYIEQSIECWGVGWGLYGLGSLYLVNENWVGIDLNGNGGLGDWVNVPAVMFADELEPERFRVTPQDL